MATAPGSPWAHTLDSGGVVNRWNAKAGALDPAPLGRVEAGVSLAASVDRCAIATTDGVTVLGRKGTPAVLTTARNGVVVAISPDGRLLAVGSKSGACELWSIAERKRIGAWPGRGSPVRSLHLADRNVLAIDAQGARIHGERPISIRIRGARCGMWNAKRDWLAVGCEDGFVRTYALPDGKPVGSWRAHATPVELLSLDGDCLVTKTTSVEIVYSPNVIAWTRSGKKRWERDFVAPASFALANATLIIGNGSHAPAAVRSADGRLRWSLDLPRDPSSLAVRPDGTLLAIAGEGGAIALRRTANQTLVRVLEGHTALVNSVRFSPDGKLLASGSWDQTVRIWNVESGESSALANGESAEAVAWSRGGKFVFSRGDEHMVAWDVERSQEVGRTKIAGDGIAIGPKYCYAQSIMGTVALAIPSLEAQGHLAREINYTSAFGVDAGGERLAAAEGDAIVLYNALKATTSPKRIQIEGQIRQIVFNATGKWLVSRDPRAGVVRLWSTAPLAHHYTMSLPDATDLAVASDRIWIATHTEIVAYAIRE